jgi:hypothetical protein
MSFTSNVSTVDPAMQRERMLNIFNVLPVNYAITPPDSPDALYVAIGQVQAAFTQHKLSREDAALAVESLFKTVYHSGIVRLTDEFFSGAVMTTGVFMNHGCDCKKSLVEHECNLIEENMSLEEEG